MNPFYIFGKEYVPYRVFDQFSEMQKELVNIPYDAKNVPSKSPLGRNLTNFCFVCSGTARANKLQPYVTVYDYNTMLGKKQIKRIVWLF